MKVIIAGGRYFNDAGLMKLKCDKILAPYLTDPDLEIVSGKARGADSLGEAYAKDNNIKIAEFPADWDKHGKAAGYIRNEEMAKYADALIAFWDGKSRGTKHMIDLAKKHRLKVRVIKYIPKPPVKPTPRKGI